MNVSGQILRRLQPTDFALRVRGGGRPETFGVKEGLVHLLPPQQCGYPPLESASDYNGRTSILSPRTSLYPENCAPNCMKSCGTSFIFGFLACPIILRPTGLIRPDH